MSADLTRRELARAAFASLVCGLAPGCRPEPTANAPESELPEFVPGQPLPWRNWGGNQACRPLTREAPESEGGVVDALLRARTPLRPVGAGHSFSGLVPSDGTLVALDLLDGIVDVDAERLQADVWAGTRLHQLGPLLHERGQAQANLPDIDYQTLGGAIATSTHGTGPDFGSLSSTAIGLRIATPSGEVLDCDAERHPEVFAAARCSLGALGIVTRVRLQNRAPIQLVETTRFESLEHVLDEVEQRRDAHRHFEFHAFPHTSVAMVVETDEADERKQPGASSPTEDPEAVYTLRDVYGWVGGLPFGDAIYDRVVRAVVEGVESVRRGPSYTVLPHVRIVRFREMEYTVPAEAGPECLREILAAVREREMPIVFPIEYRYVARDGIWLSPFYERDGCTISVHQFADQDHRDYFAAVEPIFWKYEGRPHWGKLHALDAARLRDRYPRWRDFQEVRRGLDPEGRLLNRHLRSVLET